jgi:hypothetical protein
VIHIEPENEAATTQQSAGEHARPSAPDTR